MINYVLSALDRIELLSGAQVAVLFLLLMAAVGLIVWMRIEQESE